MREKFNWAWSLTKETLCIIYLKSSNIKSLIISARRPKTCLTLFFFWPKNRAKTPKVRGQIFIYFLQCNSLRQTKLWLWRNCQTNYRSKLQVRMSDLESLDIWHPIFWRIISVSLSIKLVGSGGLI